MIRQRLREYWGEFVAGCRDSYRELSADRNWLGIGILTICLPLLFVAAVLAALGDIGPD